MEARLMNKGIGYAVGQKTVLVMTGSK